MRLLLCTDCGDAFKLVKYGERSCLCGKVKGKLTGYQSAIVNGEGISLTLDNITLNETLKKLVYMDQNQPHGYYSTNTPVRLYVQPNSGYGNPRSIVIKDHDGSSEVEILSPDKAAYRASQEINVTDEGT